MINEVTKSFLKKCLKIDHGQKYAFGLHYDHVRWCSDGKFFNVDGNEVPRKSNESYIPLKKFKIDQRKYEHEGVEGILLGSLVEGLKDLASYDFQRSAWFPNDLNICSSFSDDVDAVFADTGLENSYAENQIAFGKEIDNLFKSLQAACDAIGYARNAYELLDLSDMECIRNMAGTCLKLIRSYDGSETTVSLVSNDVMKLGIYFPDRDKL